MATTNSPFRTTGGIVAGSSITANGDIEATGVLKSTQSQVNEGGEIQLSLPSSGSTLSSNVIIDVYQNKLRFFDSGGTNKGAYIDLSAATGGVGSDLLAGGGDLNGLSDVTITSITDNEILQYDSGTSSWINQTISEAGLVSGSGVAKISYQTTAPSSPSTGDIWIDSDYTLDSLTQYMIIAVSDETTYLTTGTAKVTFRAPFAMTLPQIPRASLTTASTSGVVTVDINESGTSILSTKLSIDASEKTSTTAATAAVLSDTSIADDAEITIDIDAAGTSAAGLKIVLYYKRA